MIRRAMRKWERRCSATRRTVVVFWLMAEVGREVKEVEV